MCLNRGSRKDRVERVKDHTVLVSPSRSGPSQQDASEPSARSATLSHTTRRHRASQAHPMLHNIDTLIALVESPCRVFNTVTWSLWLRPSVRLPANPILHDASYNRIPRNPNNTGRMPSINAVTRSRRFRGVISTTPYAFAAPHTVLVLIQSYRIGCATLVSYPRRSANSRLRR